MDKNSVCLILAVLFLAVAVVAKEWHFAYRTGNYADRRNIQVLLVAALGALSGILFLVGFGVL